MIFKLIWFLTHKDNTAREWWKRLIKFRYRILPRPFDRLLMDKSDLVGAEVGVLDGFHAETLLSRLNLKHLYLVDTYQGYDAYSQDRLDQAERNARTRLCRYHRKEFIKLPSVEAARNVEPLDFCYIDAAHDYTSVKSDIESWWPRIKSGGVLGGHDFDSANPDVVKAVIEFAVGQELGLNVLDPDWWIIKP